MTFSTFFAYFLASLAITYFIAGIPFLIWLINQRLLRTGAWPISRYDVWCLIVSYALWPRSLVYVSSTRVADYLIRRNNENSICQAVRNIADSLNIKTHPPVEDADDDVCSYGDPSLYETPNFRREPGYPAPETEVN